MRYPIFIEPGTKDSAFGVVVPDLPGCFSAGDTLDEAIDNAREAVALWLEAELDKGGAIPAPTTLAAHVKDYRKWIASLVDINMNEVLGEAERVNISLPKRVLRRLDAQADLAQVNRSAYIAKLAMDQALNAADDTYASLIAEASDDPFSKLAVKPASKRARATGKRPLAHA